MYLAHIADAGATAPAASLFTASGEVATINDLLDALSGPVPQPAVPEQAESLPAAPEQAESLPPAPEAESRPAAPEAESLPAAIERVEDLPPSSVQRDADGPPARAVPLAIDLPAALAGAPDRVALVVVRGLPEGSSLSAGAASGDGSWLLAPQDLSGLSLTPPRNWASDLSVEISAIAIASPAGDLTATASTVIVPWSAAVGPEPCATGDPASSTVGEPAPSAAVSPGCCPAVAPAASASIGSASSPWVTPAPSAAVGPGCCPAVAPAPSASIGSASSPWVAPTRASIPLDLEAHFPSEGGAFDAFIVRDLPTGVSLSAGTYDPALGVWVLLPHQLTGLSILTPGGWSEDFSLSLTGVCLHAAAGPPRLLARVPVRMGH